jgi:hypothetical protein
MHYREVPTAQLRKQGASEVEVPKLSNGSVNVAAKPPLCALFADNS